MPNFRLPLGIALWLSMAAGAAAETVYLKDGTRVEGKIVASSDTALSLVAGASPSIFFTLLKGDIRVLPAPDPNVAVLSSFAMPGGGQLYLGQPQRGLFHLGGTLLAGALGFGLARQLNPADPLAAGVCTGLSMALPWGLSVLDAWREARHAQDAPRLHIE